MSAHDHDDRDGNVRALAVALAINTVFFAVELGGALYAGSLALLADAAHMLTDSASLGLALLAAWVAARPPDRKRTYGYQRAEVLGAFANGLFLVGVVVYILFDAVRRFGSPPEVNARIVVAVGLLGLVANLAAAAVLAGGRENLNVRGALLHLLVDAAGSVAAVVVGIALVFTDLYVLDPIFAVLIAGLVLYSTKDLLADSLNILLQGAPRDVDVESVVARLEALEDVVDVHHPHVWALSTSRYAMSVHVVATGDVDRNDLIRRCREVCREAGIEHTTIQVESPSSHDGEERRHGA